VVVGGLIVRNVHFSSGGLIQTNMDIVAICHESYRNLLWNVVILFNENLLELGISKWKIRRGAPEVLLTYICVATLPQIV
jgi:hypothetical protein